MHGIAVAVTILLAMTVKLELTLTLEPQVASSFAKSQGVTIKHSEEREEEKVMNFSPRISGEKARFAEQQNSDQTNVVQLLYSKCCKALRRTVNLMHGIAVAVTILLAMTVKLELPLTRQLL